MKESDALFEFLLRMGDNTLILGHRVSEWCGHAPVLEEDIALANVALDLIGQTQLWLGLASEIENTGRDADALAYRRDVWDYRNFLLVERPNGNFGSTLMRQFLFDAWQFVMLEKLTQSAEKRIADIAEKAAKEVAYLLERSSSLVIRLGDGSSESHAIMQAALDDLSPYTGEMFADDEIDKILSETGIAPRPSELFDQWNAITTKVFEAGKLTIPCSKFAHKGGRTGTHSEHLGHILSDMQFLQRAYPDAVW